MNNLDCGGKAEAATPLSTALSLCNRESNSAAQSGVALRFPPHSKTRPVIWSLKAQPDGSRFN
jgi:hypothetical protein